MGQYKQFTANHPQRRPATFFARLLVMGVLLAVAILLTIATATFR